MKTLSSLMPICCNCLQIQQYSMKQSQMRQEQSFINIKIKTLNHSLYQLIANPLKPIRFLQPQIQNKTNVPQEAQRLLYRGFVLDPEKTLYDYRIEEGNVIQLIANKIPSEQSYKSSLKRTEINKANNYSRQHNKTKKYRQLQERINGFRFKKEESLEALAQNKHTIDQLIECLNTNFMQSVVPFKMDRRKMEVGEWIDIRDASGQWIEGQIINLYGEYVFVHYNGWDNRWNEWISVNSDRIMPFRSHTVQMMTKSPYMSPFPAFQRQIKANNNSNFKTNIENLVYELTNTLDNLNSLMKELEFTRTEYEQDESLKNVSNLSIPPSLINEPLHQNCNQQIEQQRKQQFQTPNKQNHTVVGDNISNKCEDDRSNKHDNDDISNKSVKSKRSEGLVDTASMKSLIIDQSRKRQNKVFFDHNLEAQSVRSVKHKKSNKNLHYYQQEYIVQEDSQYNQQQFQQSSLIRKKELKRKMKASQLAPLLDRMGRFLIDIAPHFALLGHTDQSSNSNFNENLSTKTNEGSLLSKMSEINKAAPSVNPLFHSISAIDRKQSQAKQDRVEDQKVGSTFCSFQIPVMLTPAQLLKLQKLIETEKRSLQNL